MVYVENEKAITQMDEAAIAITGLDTDDKDGTLNMEESMKELEAWTQKVKLYK